MFTHPAAYADQEAKMKNAAAKSGSSGEDALNFSAKSSQRDDPLDKILASRQATPARLIASDGVVLETEEHNISHGSGGGGNGMESRVAKLESDVAYIRQDVDELKKDVKSIDRNMITALERLEYIKESLDKKPSSDSVDKKISEAKMAVLLGVPVIIAILSGLYKAFIHFYPNP